MKNILICLVSLSFAVNGALVFLLGLRPSAVTNPSPAADDSPHADGRVSASVGQGTPRRIGVFGRPLAKYTDDRNLLVANLRAAGFPACAGYWAVNCLVRREVDPANQQVLMPDGAGQRWERVTAADSAQHASLRKISNRFDRETRAPFPFGEAGNGFVDNADRLRYGDLSRQVIPAVREIEATYSELLAELKASMGRPTNAGQTRLWQAALSELETQRQKELEKILSADELKVYLRYWSAPARDLQQTLRLLDVDDATYSALADQLVEQARQPPSNNENELRGRMIAQNEIFYRTLKPDQFLSVMLRRADEVARAADAFFQQAGFSPAQRASNLLTMTNVRHAAQILPAAEAGGAMGQAYHSVTRGLSAEQAAEFARSSAGQWFQRTIGKKP